MNFEAPLTTLVWLTSILSIGLTYLLSYVMIPDLKGDTSLWWKLSSVISCGTLAGAVIPGVREGLYLHQFAARARDRDQLARRRRLAEHSVRSGGR